MFTQPVTPKLCTGFGLALLALGLASCGAQTSNSAVATPRYFCGQDAQGTYTTYAETPRGKQAIIRWKSEYFTASGWTPQARCQEVSPKFQQAADNNQLNYITNDTQNNLPVVCAAINDNERCGLMLFTLRPEDNPQTIREMLIDMGKGSAMNPIPQSGSFKVHIPLSEILQNAPLE
jgi:hypothetical protein